jgi:S1-C subfamily serine protease
MNLPINLVDVVAIGIVVLAVVFGWRSGFIVQVLALIGFIGGLALMVVLAPFAVDLLTSLSPWLRSLVLISVMAGIVLVAQGIGGALGAMIRRRVERGILGGLDKGAGAAFGLVRGIFLVWLIGGFIGLLPFPGLVSETRQSLILRTLDTRLPSPVVLASELGQAIEAIGLPDLFVGTSPPPAPPIDAPGLTQAEHAATAAEPSTVRVEAIACGNFVSGTGFAVESSHFVTNAHVVAGSTRVWVSFNGSLDRYRGEVVAIDPQLDVAVIDVPDLSVLPLTLATSLPLRGAPAAGLGFTGGGPERLIPAVVSRTLSALGRDIYGNAITTRDVIEIRASVAPGDSGGPLILQDGTVGGVTFSQSRDQAGIGYALSPTAVQASIASSIRSDQPVATGACVL